MHKLERKIILRLARPFRLGRIRRFWEERWNCTWREAAVTGSIVGMFVTLWFAL